MDAPSGTKSAATLWHDRPLGGSDYLYVHQRGDGKTGVSHRFASFFYRDETYEIDVPDAWLIAPPGDNFTFASAREAFAEISNEWRFVGGIRTDESLVVRLTEEEATRRTFARHLGRV